MALRDRSNHSITRSFLGAPTNIRPAEMIHLNVAKGNTTNPTLASFAPPSLGLDDKGAPACGAAKRADTGRNDLSISQRYHFQQSDGAIVAQGVLQISLEPALRSTNARSPVEPVLHTVASVPASQVNEIHQEGGEGSNRLGDNGLKPPRSSLSASPPATAAVPLPNTGVCLINLNVSSKEVTTCNVVASLTGDEKLVCAAGCKENDIYEPSPILDASSCTEDEFTNYNLFMEACDKVSSFSSYILNSHGICTERDHLYAFERAREASYHLLKPLSKSILRFRRSIIDQAMLYTSTFKSEDSPITRATLQLAISLLDRSIEELLKFFVANEDNVKLIGLALLSTAVMFEKANGSYQAGCVVQCRIMRELCSINNGRATSYFGMLQHRILDIVEYKLNSPLCVEFAHYFLIELGYDLTTSNDDNQLVAYLLDCFLIHDEAVVTPPSKAAAAAVALMRRIFNPGTPMSHLWNSNMIELSGYTLKELRPVMEAMNEMLIQQGEDINGLNALHSNGWADIRWKMP